MRHRQLRQIRDRVRRGRPMTVQTYHTLGNGFTYAVCPHCRESMDREYVPYCTQCGQHLNWQKYAQLFEETEEVR